MCVCVCVRACMREYVRVCERRSQLTVQYSVLRTLGGKP